MRNSNMPNCSIPNCNMPGCSMIEPRMQKSQIQESRTLESRMPECCKPECYKRSEMEEYMGSRNSSKCSDYPIGMAYVPWQSFRDIYEPDRALNTGTIFAELDKPFMGRRAFRR